MDNPLDNPEPDQPQFNITAGQARDRLEAAMLFKNSEAYLDFIAEYESIVTGAEAVIDDIPESIKDFTKREQALGERRIAKQVLEFFGDYVKTMRVTLDAINAALVAESEPENPESAQEEQ